MPDKRSPRHHVSWKILEVLSELHRRGHGKAKLYSYYSSLNAWRFHIFSSNTLPLSVSEIPEPRIKGSVPDPNGDTDIIESIQEYTDRLLQRNPDFAYASMGTDTQYADFLKFINEIGDKSKAVILEYAHVSRIGELKIFNTAQLLRSQSDIIPYQSIELRNIPYIFALDTSFSHVSDKIIAISNKHNIPIIIYQYPLSLTSHCLLASPVELAASNAHSVQLLLNLIKPIIENIDAE